MHLTNGNAKLGESIWNFNLPLSSCKCKTELCTRLCYAKRGHFCFKNVANHNKENLDLSKGLSMIRKIGSEIDALGVRYVRIHSSGDFYSQGYFDKWVTIAKQHPLVRFVAYTRNWFINTCNRPSNFNLFQSVDSTTRMTNPGIKRFSFMGHTGATGSVYECHKGCSECMYCYTKKGNVFFKIH